MIWVGRPLWQCHIPRSPRKGRGIDGPGSAIRREIVNLKSMKPLIPGGPAGCSEIKPQIQACLTQENDLCCIELQWHVLESESVDVC